MPGGTEMSEDYRPFRDIYSVDALKLLEEKIALAGTEYEVPAGYFTECTAIVTMDCDEDGLFVDGGQTLLEGDTDEGNGWRLWLDEYAYLRFASGDGEEKVELSSPLPVHAAVDGSKKFRLGVSLANYGYALRGTPSVSDGCSYARVVLLAGAKKGPLSIVGIEPGPLNANMCPLPKTLKVGDVQSDGCAGNVTKVTVHNTGHAELFTAPEGKSADDILPPVNGGGGFAARWVDDETVLVFTRPEFSQTASYWVFLQIAKPAKKMKRLRVNTIWRGGVNMTPTFFWSSDRKNWTRMVPERLELGTGGHDFCVEFKLNKQMRKGGYLASCPIFGEEECEELLEWAQTLEHVSVAEIGESAEGRPLHVIRVSNGEDGPGKKGVAFTCGQHSPLEIMGAWVLQPMIASLLGHDWLLDACNFYFVPVVNADCAHYGGNGLNANKRNTNRCWFEDIQPETGAVMEYFDALKDVGQSINLAMDLHAGGIFRNHILMHMGETEDVKLSEAEKADEAVWRELLEEHAGLRAKDGWALAQLKLRANDYFHQKHGCTAFCLELSTCSYYDPATGQSRPFGQEAFEVLGKGFVEAFEGRFGPDREGAEMPEDEAELADADDALSGQPEFYNLVESTEENPRSGEGSMVSLKDGRIFFVYGNFTGGEDHAVADIVSRISDDCGKTWSAPKVLVSHEEAAQNVMSASLLRLQDGGVLLLYLRKDSSSRCRAWVRRSDDDCLTWSEAVCATPDERYHVIVNDALMQLRDGRVVVPFSAVDEVFGNVGGSAAGTVWSDDGGKTWSQSGNQVYCPERGAMEPNVVERADGSLLMYVRTDQGSIWETTSDNRGESWNELVDSGIESPQSPLALRRIPSTGDLLLVWNPVADMSATGHQGHRTPYACSVSKDDGQTWGPEKLLETNLEQTYCYTNVLFHEDMMVLSYYIGQPGRPLEALRVARVPVAWLYEPKDEEEAGGKCLSGNVEGAGEVAEWQERRRETLAAMQVVMGEMPPRSRVVPAAIATWETVELDRCTRRKITIASEKGDRLPAYVFVPKGIEGKAPAMVCLHQTTEIGKGEPAGIGGLENLHYALELAERGYVTIAPDYPGFGDYERTCYDLGYVSCSMKGIFNHMRAVDLLQSMDEVDGERIGAIGHSLGGHNSLFLAAFDERVKVAVTSCGFNSFTKYRGGDISGWSHDGYMPKIASEYGCDGTKMPFDFGEVLAAIAPRAIFANAPLHDSCFEIEGVHQSVDEAMPVFEQLGARDKFVSVFPDCEHDFPIEIREQAYTFVDGILKK